MKTRPRKVQPPCRAGFLPTILTKFGTGAVKNAARPRQNAAADDLQTWHAVRFALAKFGVGKDHPRRGKLAARAAVLCPPARAGRRRHPNRLFRFYLTTDIATGTIGRL
jgi:hypothetical protein